MTLTIPVWLLWVLGIACGLTLLGLAALGVMFLWLKPWEWRPF